MQTNMQVQEELEHLQNDLLHTMWILTMQGGHVIQPKIAQCTILVKFSLMLL